jgi:hypothetical protein
MYSIIFPSKNESFILPHISLQFLLFFIKDLMVHYLKNVHIDVFSTVNLPISFRISCDTITISCPNCMAIKLDLLVKKSIRTPLFTTLYISFEKPSTL